MDGDPRGPFPANAIFDPRIDPETLALSEDPTQEEANYAAWLAEAHSAWEEGEGSEIGEPETPAERQEREEEAHEEAVANKEERLAATEGTRSPSETTEPAPSSSSSTSSNTGTTSTS